jgi:hypothetical protein
VSINSAGIFSALTSHAQALGVFDSVNGHEPKNAPGNGVSASVWLSRLRPVKERSGLVSVSVAVELTIRIFMPMLSQPEDDIDPKILTATDKLVESLVGDFDLGATVANVDMFGAMGVPMDARAGYFDQDGKKMRAMVVTVPVVVNDVWAEAA